MAYIEERVTNLERSLTHVADRLERVGRAVSRYALADVEPTWTDSNGRTSRLRDMPTRYLANVRKFAAEMAGNRPRAYRTGSVPGTGSGLVNAIDAELARRAETE